MMPGVTWATSSLCWAVLMLSERMEQLANKKQDQRRRHWALINEQEPQLAALLTAVNQAFGKPVSSAIEVAREVISAGIAEHALLAWDGKLRRVGNGRR